MTQASDKDAALRIGELAKVLETTTKTLRHYEKMGLIKPSHRTRNGYRVYDKVDQRHVRQVMGLRRIGLSIPEVQDLQMGGSGTLTVRQRLLGLLDEKLRDIDETLGILQGRRDDLAARYLSLFDTPADRDEECICNALLQPCDCARLKDYMTQGNSSPDGRETRRSTSTTA